MSTKSDFISAMQKGYGDAPRAIQLGAALWQGEVHANAPVRVPLRTLNRHGLISGATGTGKTKTLSLLAENLSEHGVPVLVMDIKGDFSGIAMPGAEQPKIQERHQKIGLPWSPSAYPVEFLSLSGEQGARLRATVLEFGPVLFSKLLGLNETQGSLVALVFKFCDDKRLPLLDLKDFKKVLEYITGEAKDNVTAEYGLVPVASVSLILRKLIELEQQGAGAFFGEKSFEVADLCRQDNGFGIISVLRLTDIQDRPKLFSSFMLQLLGEIYASFPEAGDTDQPKLVLFIDEAHLLFEEAEKALLEQIETVIKLIRSKGVGIFFCTQTPRDIPEAVLSQLGLKIQHALRAFTAKDRKDLKLIAENFPDSPFYQTEELLTTLGIGEALITALDERGIPTPLAATLLCAPRSRMGPLTAEEIDGIIARSSLLEKYNTPIDPNSAYEILGGKLDAATTATHRPTYTPGAPPPAPNAARKPPVSPTEAKPYPTPASGKESDVFGALMKTVGGQMVKQAGRSFAAAAAGAVARSLLGVLGLGGRRR